VTDDDSRAVDPREFGLTAADLNDVADLIYAPGDSRLEPVKWDQAAQVRYGQIRSRLRDLAGALETAGEVF
jgi:hypothetical protein